MRTLRFAVPFVLALAGVAIGDPGPSIAERRAAIEAVMRKMEAATTTADAKAYMALVDPSDAVFFKEQSNLAKEWAKHKVQSCTLAIVEKKAEEEAKPEAAAPDAKPAEKPAAKPEEAKPEAKPEGEKADKPARDKDDEVGVGVVDPVFDDARAEFRMQMTWKLPDWKRERSLTMPVVFLKDARSGAWLYAGEKWDAVVAPATDTFNGVRVLYEPGNTRLKKTADTVVKVMPEVRASVDAHFKLKVSGPVTVKLYQSMRHLQASIWLSYTDGLGGWNEPGEAIKILPSTRSSAEGLKSLLGHEYGHCATFTMGPHATDAAWWALEGAAELASAPFRKDAARRRDNRVRDWMKNGDIADWDRISPFPLPKEDEQFQPQVYTQGEHMLAFMATRYGDEARINFMRRLCEGKTTDEASRDALGLSWADVDAAWRQSIQQKIGTEPKDDK
jgi:hypothetical protein